MRLARNLFKRYSFFLSKKISFENDFRGRFFFVFDSLKTFFPVKNIFNTKHIFDRKHFFRSKNISIKICTFDIKNSSDAVISFKYFF